MNGARLQIVVIPERCDGCAERSADAPLPACIAACAGRFSTQNRDPDLSAINLIGTQAGVTPALCLQCEDAACVRACPAEANLYDPHGVVRHDPKRCLACQLCVAACAFGNIHFIAVARPATMLTADQAPIQQSIKSRIVKCDLCGYAAAGALADAAEFPRCVKACPQRALTLCQADPIGDLDAVSPD